MPDAPGLVHALKDDVGEPGLVEGLGVPVHEDCLDVKCMGLGHDVDRVPVHEVGGGEPGLDEEFAKQGFVDGVLGQAVAHVLKMQEVSDREGLRCGTS